MLTAVNKVQGVTSQKTLALSMTVTDKHTTIILPICTMQSFKF